MRSAAALEVVRTLVTATQQVKHYGPEHPAAHEAVARVRELLQTMMKPGSGVHLEAGPHWLKVETAVLPVEERYVRQLVDQLVDRRVQRLSFHPGLTHAEVAAFVRLLALEPEELIAQGGIEDALRESGAAHVSVHPPGAQVVPTGDEEEGFDPVTSATRTVHTLASEVERGDPIDVARAHLAVERIAAGLSADRLGMWHRIAGRAHDELDPIHPVVTSALTMLVADALNLSSNLTFDLGAAALLHDIGLAALPWQERLRERTASGPLPSWRHPAEGAYLLREAVGRSSLALIAALEHHLPAVAREASVSPHARLVGLVDYFDAMTSARLLALRPAAPGELIARLQRGEGPRFDPVHVRVLAGMVYDAIYVGVDLS